MPTRTTAPVVETRIRASAGVASIRVALANRQDEDMHGTPSHTPRRPIGTPFALGLGALLALAGCGGGGSGDAAQAALATAGGAAATGGTASMSLDAAALPADAASAVVLPTFHVAPVVLADPGDADAVDPTASAFAAPHVQGIGAEMAALGTQRLTVQAIEDGTRARALDASRILADGRVAPAAAAVYATTYTPAQIRAAYGLPALPAAGLTPTALQAAQQGAGQTIYIVDALHDPNAAAELAAFNAKFGLPTCKTKVIAVGTALPLAAAPAADGCTFSVVYSTPSGTMTASAPAYDAGWATEIALDVQWAHATAPLARIVLIESADTSSSGLLGAVRLANAMGAGAVSMSFGGSEGSWTSQVDAAFTGTGMSYLAATGDSGSGVAWPAVSPNVLAVGGTTLGYSGSGARSESAWSKGGGGISGYVATPAYQSNKVPGLGTLAHRGVADVSFNADPYTGQYVAILTPGSTTAKWLGAGGTSLSTPQWAGLVAVANALRVQSGKALLGAPHAALYSQIATVPGTYAAGFADVASGSNGSCSTCVAKTGYDTPTGLGTPNAAALLTALGAATTTAAATPTTTASTAPVITAPSLAGVAGKPISGAITFASPSGSGLTIQLGGIPAGLQASLSGASLLLYWPSPVAGSYTLAVTAKDSAGSTSSATLAITVTAK